MMVPKYYKYFLTIILHALTFTVLKAQNEIPVLADSEFSIVIPISKSWVLKSGLTNRNYFIEEGDILYRQKHIEINQFVDFKLDKANKFSLGTRYRFKEAFEATETNELRFLQQYIHLVKGAIFDVTYRLRQEERFREELSFRTRFRLSFIFPIGKPLKDSKQFYLVADTESVWSYGKFEGPELGQRWRVGLQNNFFERAKFSLGPEFRYNSYLRNPKSELFLISEVSISL